jgi:two-component system sensor histidine kinase/response regulator
MRLLIVDDEPIVLKALAMVLTRDGHPVDKARGGGAGIESFQAAVAAGQPFDAVITDCDMPDADGHQVDGTGVDRVLDKMSPLEELRGALQAVAGIKD